MKNCYISSERLKEIEAFEPGQGYEFYSCDPQSAEQYEKLNPLLSNGHRLNPISAIVDKSAPNEVLLQLQQFLQRLPIDRSIHDLTDEELVASLPSRYVQQQPDMDALRKALIDVAEQLGIGDDVNNQSTEPQSTEPQSTEPQSTEPQAGGSVTSNS